MWWDGSRRGTIWSKVKRSGLPQYWHWKRSRRNRLKRVKAGYSLGRTYCRSAITEGSLMPKLALWTSRS